jgi:hypothetical protein
VLSPDGRRYSPSDVRIVEAIGRFRAGGYDERIVELIEAGAEPLQDLIAALHTKLLVAELERHRAARS